MRNPNEYSIELNLYNKNNPVEITRFFSVVFDTRKVNLSAQNKKKALQRKSLRLFAEGMPESPLQPFFCTILITLEKSSPPCPAMLCAA